ncbi:MAG TPA: DUF924 family protein [Burkholderiales bacterium]|nr:DUF924 family protein [Burkholderiales bacterium]
MTPGGGFSEVLDFWFGAPDSPSRGRARKAWFAKSDELDREVRDRFLQVWEAAMRGDLDSWGRTPLAALALIVVLDQFPRNMFRGKAAAFASDDRALRLAMWITDNERRFDRLLRPIERAFVYLPFQHAEDPIAQSCSLLMYEDLAAHGVDHREWARRHDDIIQRFGRFPHRNEILGRESTPEEIEFLKQPGSRF